MIPISAKKYLVCGLLLLIVLFALALRLWRLDFGLALPYLAHPDEPRIYNNAVGIIQSGDLNPHDFYKPTLTIYLNALVMYASFAIGKLFGAYESLAKPQPMHLVNMGVGLVGTPAMLLLGRATSAVFGVLTVSIVFAVTRELTRRKWVPFSAAALLAISSLHIQLSHYMTVDVIATFFAVASVSASTLALSRKNPRYLWVSAVCGGLAASSKYSYAVLVVSVGLACLLYGTNWRDRIKHTLLCGALFFLGFALTSPFVLLDHHAAIRGILYEVKHYAGGHLGMTGNSVTWYLGLLWDVNPFYLLLGIPGLVLAVARGKRPAWPMTAFIVVYFSMIARQATHFDRNVLPVMALLIVMAGIAVESLVDFIPARVRDWRIGPNRLRVSPVVLGAILIPLLPSLLALSGFLQPPSPSGRAMAQGWFDRTIETPIGKQYLHKDGSRTLKIAAEAYTTYLDPDEYPVEYMNTITRFGGGLSEIKEEGYDMIILGSGMFGRFYSNPESFAREVAVYEALFDQEPHIRSFEDLSGSGVYVIFLTEQARQFETEASLSETG